MSDLIDRQALLDECLNHYEVGNIEQNCTMNWICKTVRNFPTASPWNRVEEPPKEVGSYLTAYCDGFVCENQWHYIGPTAIGWVNDAEAVRYWMPLPEPPKEENDGN